MDGWVWGIRRGSEKGRVVREGIVELEELCGAGEERFNRLI